MKEYIKGENLGLPLALGLFAFLVLVVTKCK